MVVVNLVKKNIYTLKTRKKRMIDVIMLGKTYFKVVS